MKYIETARISCFVRNVIFSMAWYRFQREWHVINGYVRWFFRPDKEWDELLRSLTLQGSRIPFSIVYQSLILFIFLFTILFKSCLVCYRQPNRSLKDSNRTQVRIWHEIDSILLGQFDYSDSYFQTVARLKKFVLMLTLISSNFAHDHFSIHKST